MERTCLRAQPLAHNLAIFSKYRHQVLRLGEVWGIIDTLFCGFEKEGCNLKAFQDRIRRDGKVLPGSIIKVDGFLNHRVDVQLLRELAQEFKKRFDLTGLTAVLTVEASGIALATLCAEEFGVPLVFAKKAKSDNIEGGLYQSDIYSYTYKKKVTLLVSSQWLGSGDRVLIVDDFLANGEALRGLVEIVQKADAELIGIGVAVEKGFQSGGEKLRAAGYKLESLAVIEQADENGFVFRREGQHA